MANIVRKCAICANKDNMIVCANCVGYCYFDAGVGHPDPVGAPGTPGEDGYKEEKKMSYSYSTLNKINCTICAHYEVCSKKEEYKKAQEAVERVSVTLGESSDGIVTMDLRNIDWIKPVVLECVHFLTRPVNIRSGDPGEIFG